MSGQLRIAALLDLADADAEAAHVLAGVGNRNAAYHCQQAVEKLAKAVLLHRGIEAGVEHRLDVLVGRLLSDDAWNARLRPLERLTPFATTFRYPTPGGRIPAPPDATALRADIAAVRGLIALGRAELSSPAGPR